MPTDLPYMASAQNLGAILDKIRSASTPPKFTHEFLKANLGFGSSNDRAVIKVLKQLGFLSADSTPTARYNEYRGPNGGQALAAGLREGWAPLFLSDEQVQAQSSGSLVEVVRNVTGAGDAVAKKIATTFKTLADRADWTTQVPVPAKGATGQPQTEADEPASQEPQAGAAESLITAPPSSVGGSLRLHQDIHIHLPPTSDVSVYRAIFQAMKAELQ